jgi:5-methyltetrahydropteroyltriglutamate--homocysteine methyltransferase
MGAKTMIVGVIDLGTAVVEPQDQVENRIRAALEYIEPHRLVLAPDCGMKYLPRASAFEKLHVMTRAAQAVRNDLRVPTGGGKTRP